MRMFFEMVMARMVDLDDAQTYNHLPNKLQDLQDLMFKKIGYYYWYTNFHLKESFDKRDGGQKKRCEELIQKFTNEKPNNLHNAMWYKEQIFLFQDEIENMC